ncbi:sugar phosphate isomerase/epimerase family protein [Microbacterium sp. E-13]|uniref:sugar phosphate isomerase/epimerase family protein n=1 Tax=Microbacterium sp. E-13 TaxID=3404048 RepID=UPI003CF5AD19
MPITRNQIALNALQWINLKQEPGGPADAPIWLYDDPAWRSEQPNVHRLVKAAGFDAVMMEVLNTQTIQAYKRMLDDVGLRPAPGYVQVGLPEDYGLTLQRGSAQWVRWFDPIRRRAEETNYMGLDSVFLAADMAFDGRPRIAEVAVGAQFDQGRLDRLVELLTDAAEVLRAEGVRAGAHNHVGTWLETEYEIDYLLANTDPSLLGASLDVGHLEWAGIDSPAYLAKHRDRLIDLHLKDLDLSIAAESRRRPTSYFTVADQRFFLEPGLGDIDLAGAISALGEDFAGWIVIEVDRASMEPFDSARFSNEWVEATFPEHEPARV